MLLRLRRPCTRLLSSFSAKEKEIAKLQRSTKSFIDQGQYMEALEVAKDCSKKTLEHFGDRHPVFAASLSNLGFLHKTLGAYQDAVDAYERALHVYKDSVGENHRNYATTLNNLGLVYRTQAQVDKQSGVINAMGQLSLFELARDCFEYALKIREKVLEQDHPDIAMSRCNLGVLLYHSGQLSDGRAMVEQVVDQLRHSVGEKHALTATAMNNLALIMKGMDMYDEAIALYLKVKKIREELFGTSHPDTITVCYNLSEAYEANGDTEKAQALRHYIVELTDKQFPNNT